MIEISRNIFDYKAARSFWLILGIIIASSFFAFVIPSKFIEILVFSHAPLGMYCEAWVAGVAESPKYLCSIPDILSITDRRIIILFGIVFCIASGAISAIVLLMSLPIFLFSSNSIRVSRAGGLVKTTLGFFLGSASAIVVTISFAKIFE